MTLKLGPANVISPRSCVLASFLFNGRQLGGEAGITDKRTRPRGSPCAKSKFSHAPISFTFSTRGNSFRYKIPLTTSGSATPTKLFQTYSQLQDKSSSPFIFSTDNCHTCFGSPLASQSSQRHQRAVSRSQRMESPPVRQVNKQQGFLPTAFLKRRQD